MIRIDLHVHTECSRDGSIRLRSMIDLCRKKGLQGVAITDHNTIEGAVYLKERAPHDFTIIVGEEINTCEGEIIGLFIKDRIKPGQSVESTVQEIHGQGGVVCIPHPFCRFRSSRLSIQATMRIMNKIDMIEIFNSRNIIDQDNKRSYELAQRYGKAMVSGSDAHLSYEIGRSHVIMEPFQNTTEFLHNIAGAHLVSQTSPLWVHASTKIKKLLSGKRSC